DVLLHRADRDRAEAVVERAAALAQPVLRTHAAADFRQWIGLVAQGRCLADAALTREFQPLRNAFRHLPRLFAEAEHGLGGAGFLRFHFAHRPIPLRRSFWRKAPLVRGR